MRALSTLIKVHRHALDEKRRALTDLENLRADLIGQRDKLDADLVREQDVAKQVECGAFAYAGFHQGYLQRRDRLMASLSELETRIAAAQQDVSEAYQDVKRHEIALAARQRKQREEEERRAQNVLDEVSLDMHRRRSA
jgi:flagellar biosynthesis chaperone FliJ